MVTRLTRKFFSTVLLAAIPYIVLSLLPLNSAWTQTPSCTDIQVSQEKLKSKDAGDRADAALALGSIGAVAQVAVSELLAALKDDNYQVRWNAAEALGKIRAATKAEIPLLTAALQDQDSSVRFGAAYALAVAQAQAKAAVPVLLASLKNGVELDRPAIALGLFGAQAKEAVPQMFAIEARLLEGLDEDARISNSYRDFIITAAAIDEALVKISSQTKVAFPAAMAALNNSDAWIRRSAVRTLGAAGIGARGGVPQLTALLKDGDELVRSFAANALGDIAVDLGNQASLLSKADLEIAIVNLYKAEKALENSAIESKGTQITQVKLAIAALKSRVIVQ